ncbi:MAG: MFS transporter [Liquorilactobacillus nagelii]|uniref:MFS transporter n=1 Tax=Liquorilactobacillus nagelii TaxID=82688 RepID=A0A3S6QTE0_9LACO|nr:MFS transporter [Liquorilactobacillus nagelii]AUJ31288.1 MFS transporter [Liquorilactobacillus nagelii]MCC7616148.1 MFS transporter [Liquorilactobacillus nagelii]MCI1699233.1 MFS transporter [Liquorilactobacillus nagelii]MCP9315042.1 MFS transporter [Liquorilactobacillus nagelii]QYH54781.1 MFS transporter [Liquorilactobacillus nagelii DSM 13675]
MKRLKLKWLLLGSLLASTGTSFMWPLTTVYMHDYLHQSLSLAGVVLLVESLVMIGGSYIGGYIFDHLQVNFWLQIAIGLSVISLLLLIFFNGWPAYPCLLIINAFGGAIANTIVNSMATLITEKDSRYVFNMLYFMANIGVVLGTMLVGIVVKYDIRLIFVITFIMFIFFWLIARTYYHVPLNNSASEKNVPSKHVHLEKTSHRHVWLIMGLLLTYLAIQLGYSQWQSNLSIYMQSLGISLTKYSYLWTLNGILIVILQPFLSFLEEHYHIDQFYKVLLGFILFILAFISLIFAKDYWHFVFSMVWVTIGEVITFPTVSSLAAQLSSIAERGKYQGSVSIAASLGHAFGPLLGGIIIEKASYEWLFSMMSILVIFATIICVLIKFMLFNSK